MLLGGISRDGHEVDAVAVALLVGDVVAQVRAVNAHGLSILEHAHVLPVHLLVPAGSVGRK